MFKKTRIPAFTLLEALVALLVISGSVLLFQSMTKLLASEVRYQQTNDQREWLLFAEQLEAELAQTDFEKVEGNRLYVRKAGRSIAFGKSKGSDFRKTDASGRGYQPMIYGLKETRIWQEDQLVHIRLLFQQGLEREFVYRVEKKG